MGRLLHTGSERSQLSQNERGATIDISRGTRYVTTVTKLPVTAPTTNARAPPIPAGRSIPLRSALRFDHADDHRALAGTVPLREHEPLPSAEPELGARDRDIDRGTQHRAQDMRLRVAFAMAKTA